MALPKGTTIEDGFKPKNWEDIKDYAKNDLQIKIDFTKHLIVAINDKKEASKVVFPLEEIIPVENSSHELYSILRSTQDLILKTLENKNYIEDTNLYSSTQEVYPTYFKDILYLSFKIKSSELKKYLREFLGLLLVEKIQGERILKVGYSLTLDETEGLFINKKYRVSKPTYRSMPYKVIEYALANSNRKIDKDELIMYLDLPAKRELRHIISELGFKGILKDLFFEVKKSYFILYNNITKGDVKKRGFNFTEIDLKLKEI